MSTITFLDPHPKINRQVTINEEDRLRYFGMTSEDRLKHLAEPAVMDAGRAPMAAPVESEIDLKPRVNTTAQTDTPKENAKLQGDTAKAVNFMKQFCAATKTYPVGTAIHTDPVTGAKGRIESKAFKPNANGEIDWIAVHNWIESLQGVANIYFNVNPRVAGAETKIKAKMTEVAGIVAAHVDIDCRVGEDQVEGIARIVKNLRAYKKPPNIINASGGGAQGFWVGKDMLPADGTEESARDLAGINRALERDLDGDHCSNLDRLMRWPYTINIPNEVKIKKGRVPALAYVVSMDLSTLYDLSTFERMPDPSRATTSIKADSASDRERGAKAATPKKSAHEFVYQNVPMANDDTPIMSLEDPRLSAMDRWCKEYVRAMTLPDDAPADVKAKLGNNGWWDFKIACECCRINLTDAQIKQTWKAGKIGTVSGEWPRGFDGDMDRLIERAREATRDPHIEKMNADHFVICVEGKYRIGTWQESKLYEGQREPVLSTVDDFRFGYRNLKVTVMVKTQDDEGNEVLKPKRVSLVDYWLRHPQCRQYNRGFVFKPQSDSHSYNGALNRWRGFRYEPKEGKWDKFQAHMLDNICDGNKEHYDYVIRWMAFVVQKRTRTEVAILLRSDEEGTGKGVFAKTFGALFGPHYMQINNPEHIFGKFNPHLETLLVINADEAMFAGDPRHRNALWGLVTEDWITIEPKGYAAYKAPNHLNHIVTTNARDAMRVNRTARRIFALNVAAHQMQNVAYFEAILDQMRDGGYAAMLHDLLRLDLSGFDVRNCPKTEALYQQQTNSRNGVDRLVEEACSTAIAPCPSYRWPGFSLVGGYEDRNGFDWSIDNHPDPELKRMRGLRVKRELADKWQCKIGNGVRKREKGRTLVRGIEWPSLSELRAKFVALHGPQQWESPEATDWLLPNADVEAAPAEVPAAMGEGQGAQDTGGTDDQIPF